PVLTGGILLVSMWVRLESKVEAMGPVHDQVQQQTQQLILIEERMKQERKERKRDYEQYQKDQSQMKEYLDKQFEELKEGR
ncbi:MAG: hypothetical protein ACYSWU_17980, partial [Planctomycetota bacterium]